MKTRKISVILIALAFMLVVVFSGVGIFSLKKVYVSYAVSEKTDSEKIQSALDGYIGDNLLFMNLSDVEKTLKNFHYMEVISVQKQYPNVLNVQLKERREVYFIRYDDGYYVTTDDGFVLRKMELSEISNEISRDKIFLDFEGINVLTADTGSYIKTDNDSVMNIVFEMAKSVNLTDCIKSITVEKIYEEMGVGVFDASFNTYTGVSMKIEDVLVSGVEKSINAFNVYDDLLSDFQKADGQIQSYVMRDGTYRVTYNQALVWTSEN